MERVFVVLVTAVIVPVFVWSAFEEDRQWRDFAKQNHCKVVEYIRSRSDTAYVFGQGNQLAIIQHPGRTIFECKGGVRYTR